MVVWSGRTSGLTRPL